MNKPLSFWVQDVRLCTRVQELFFKVVPLYPKQPLQATKTRGYMGTDFDFVPFCTLGYFRGTRGTHFYRSVPLYPKPVPSAKQCVFGVVQ